MDRQAGLPSLRVTPATLLRTDPTVPAATRDLVFQDTPALSLLAAAGAGTRTRGATVTLSLTLPLPAQAGLGTRSGGSAALTVASPGVPVQAGAGTRTGGSVTLRVRTVAERLGRARLSLRTVEVKARLRTRFR